MNIYLFTNGAYETGYKLGYIIALLVMLGFLILFVVGLFFLIRYVTRKKRKPSITKLSKQKEHQERTIVCRQCETENRLDSKYCIRCGYELL